MKVKAKQYAQALFLEIKDKNKEESLLIIEKFFNILKQDNNLSQVKKIIFDFSNFWNKEYSLVDASVVIAQSVDKGLEGEIIEYLKKLSKSEKVQVSFEENKKIIGGLVLKYEDKIIDASIKNKINVFKNNLLN